MVNYCCVKGCGRNSKQNKHLNYYSLPKERRRQVEWLEAAGREDLLEKDKVLVSHRFCSRHFLPSAIKNKHLCDTAMPTLCLPGSSSEEEQVHQHKGIVCDSCGLPIQGFRYKCVSCDDYDLCQKCEMRETHPEHFMLRMPKPLKFKVADDLIQEWRSFFNANHMLPDSDEDGPKYDSDDEPITKYVRNYDSGIDLSDDVKKKIRDEVARVLNAADVDEKNLVLASKKRTGDDIERSIKRIRIDGTIGYDDEDREVPEVVFADVNADNNLMEVKNEVPYSSEQPARVHVKLSADLTEFMIEVSPSQRQT